MENEQTTESPECGCGGPARSNPSAGPHRVGDPGCFRELVPIAPVALPAPQGFGVNWKLGDGSVISEFSLIHQRGYSRHECGRWSRQLGGSSNSIREETSEWQEIPRVAAKEPRSTDPISIVEDLNLECYDFVGDCFTPFEVSSNGYSTAVTFCGYPIWGTEDNGERTYDEDTDTYEPLIGYLRREARRLLSSLVELHNHWEGNTPPP